MRHLIIFLCFFTLSHAQLVVHLKTEKEQLIAHEKVNVILTITNRAGKALNLQGQGRKNWLDINVHNQAGELLAYRGNGPIFKSAVIQAGQSIKRTIPISDFYHMHSFGRYRAQAFVKLPGDERTSIQSNNTSFLITTGRTLFRQRIGLPNTGNARTYEVISFNADKNTDLYVKVTNDYSGQVTSCQKISKMVPFRKPNAQLDRNNNLNILYLITPVVYIHTIISPTGKIIKRQYHKQGAVGNPRLEAFANGDVKVAGTIPYDPVKARKAAQQRKKVSDRPKLVF